MPAVKISKNPKTVVHSKAPVKARYYFAIGGRKTARALVRLFIKKGPLVINGKGCGEYFRAPKHQEVVRAPFRVVNMSEAASAEIKVYGSGLNAQAEAIRNALAKALVLFNKDFKPILRREGYLTRDSRMVERKKYGLKKARRAPQWAKR